MGRDDDDFDDYPELPSEAGQDTPIGFEPDNVWFATASSELRREAMRRWFLSRYCDPVHNTPYNSEEGGYLFIHGSVTAEGEIYRRFGSVSDDEEIAEVIDDIESDGTERWSPIHYDDRDEEFDDRFALALQSGSEPLQMLRGRLRQSQEVLTLQGSGEAMRLAERLVFTSLIAALEAYLYEVAYFWIDTDETALRSLVEGLPAFREEKVPLGDLYKRRATIKEHVKGHLQNMVWHRWKAVAQIFKYALSVQLPSVRAFEGPLLKRHDIVHRSGQDKSGKPIVVTVHEISELSRQIEVFAVELDAAIDARVMVDLSVVDGPEPVG